MNPFHFGCKWEEGLWSLVELKSIETGFGIMRGGIGYLSGNFTFLVGSVTIERQPGSTSGALPGVIYYQVDRASEFRRLYSLIHEMGHVVMLNHMPQTLNYFMNELEAKCLNGTTNLGAPSCFTYPNDPTNDDQYKPGRYGVDESGNPLHMPSSYSLRGNWEDFAETFTLVVTEAYTKSGGAFMQAAELVYNDQKWNKDIGRRRKVMKAIINGLWR